jgi:dihydropteroate synthase
MNRLGNVSVGEANPIRIMGILNTSPESFYKKTIVTEKQSQEKLIRKIVDAGADFIDVGGMSTAPYLSTLVSEKIESKRILPAIKRIQQICNLAISVDTCRASVAKDALDQGVEIINDISGLKYDKKMVHVIEKYQPSLILCAFSKKLVTGNQINKTKDLLKQSLALAKSVNISRKKIVLDPAIGFFRRTGTGPFFTKINSDWLKRDLLMLNNLRSIKMKQPLLVSVSNKSFIGKLLNIKNISDRLFGSVVTEAMTILNGADIIRTHNVRETKDTVKLVQSLAQKKSRKAYNAS